MLPNKPVPYKPVPYLAAGPIARRDGRAAEKRLDVVRCPMPCVRSKPPTCMSAAAACAPAVQALAAAAVAHHDRAAVGAAGGVGLGLDAHLRGAPVEGDGRGAAAVPVCL